MGPTTSIKEKPSKMELAAPSCSKVAKTLSWEDSENPKDEDTFQQLEDKLAEEKDALLKPRKLNVVALAVKDKMSDLVNLTKNQKKAAGAADKAAQARSAELNRCVASTSGPVARGYPPSCG